MHDRILGRHASSGIHYVYSFEHFDLERFLVFLGEKRKEDIRFLRTNTDAYKTMLAISKGNPLRDGIHSRHHDTICSLNRQNALL